MKPKIIVHCLVKNEERFIWYSLNSVLPFVNKIMVWDTGSTDKTVDIVKIIKSSKISFKEVGDTTVDGFPALRQRMLKETAKKFDWLMILDGDEIWPEDSMKEVVNFLSKHKNYDSVVVHTHNLVGDIYHSLPESAGQYQFKNSKGHLALRFINLKIPGLSVKNPYGQEGYFDKSGVAIQNRDPKKLMVLNVFYFHATHLPRSSKDKTTLKREFKFKYELGNKIDSQAIPTVFFKPRPKVVPLVTNGAPFSFWLLASILTPIRRLKRVLFTPSSGY